MEELLEQISKRHLGDLASILGLLASLVGFWWTILIAWRSTILRAEIRLPFR
jgi:hypothetical protein